MSHYDCVLPVDFERLRDVVMPAWIEFIAGERAPRDFADEFAPWQVGVADRNYWPENNWLEPFDIPAPYIEWFRARPMAEWIAEDVRCDVEDLLTSPSLPWCATDLLALAIKQSCAVELPGQCPSPNAEFYNRLHDPPFVQVTGTKTPFRFMGELYEMAWQQTKNFYAIKRKGIVEERTYAPLERLCFNVRYFPGTWWLMKESLVWKSSDELQLSGFLTPEETGELAERIAELKGATRPMKNELWDFDLFPDCVRRAADCQAGLVTIFGGL